MIGRFDAVSELLDLADDVGQTRPRLEEAALLVAPYGGIPRAIETLGLLAARFPGATERRLELPDSLGELEARGRACFEQVYGENTEAVLAGLDERLPGFARYVLTAAYGSVLSRDGLSLGEREILAVAALGLAGLPRPLGSHIRGALRNGFLAPVVEDTLLACEALADARARDTLAQARDRLSRKVYAP